MGSGRTSLRFGRAARLAVVLGLLVAAGCRTNNRVSLDPLTDKTNAAANDPLRGGGPKPSAGAGPSAQAKLLAPDLGAGSERQADAPSPTLGGPSTAALASNAKIGLESPKGPIKAAIDANNRQATWTPSSGITWEQAREILKARGASWSPPEMRSDGLWYFHCSVPNPDNPSVSRVYEASDSSDLGAVRKALANLGS